MTFRPLLLAAALAVSSLTGQAPVQAQGLSGPYLAARIAGYGNDYDAAAEYYVRLLDRGAREPRILENAVVIHSALGQVEEAAEAARLLDQEGAQSQFADGALLLEALVNEEYETARAMILDRGVAGALLDGLLLGWMAVAEGDQEAAMTAFQDLAETEGFAPIAHLHRAFALAMTGDYAAADDILSGRSDGPIGVSARGVEAHAQILLALDRPDDALELLTQANAQTNRPALQDLAQRVEAGEEIGWSFVTEPAHGMAEAYFTLAAIFAGETSSTFTLLAARAANALRADHVDALVLTAELLDEQQQYDLAVEVLNRVPGDDPAYFGAEITRAEALLAAEKEDAAVEVLSALTKSHPDRQTVWAAYGDTLRRLERFQESAAAYDRALELAPGGQARNWYLHYVRGIALERTDQWDAAEADFRAALELNPDQPQVLNYLGYGLVEKRVKLAEALDMIERAVAARPEDGYITDSLAWVLYRLGRFEEAVEPMERAVDLEPLDPIINDHLGDVLWKVGRKREAEFQWERALSLDPEEEDAERIRRKLEVGLDVVLEEEGGVGALEAAEE
ncbi:tetratricopeptide repeat protein [Jannaschia seohaensis]|uniref:Tetratricopeptide repeat protein n=1 Tax=Jannaschia seohaensis TaxID=475081 RepID=A0A2Y9AVY0_9RHOB|nr:tetratricopeptide repeat protein [Jannaschia seohaensis]PWJ18152.1 tetratricopeptide repeat protein [Jannaschia seohaensis]SSA46677.1 Tetratricopeptide repeat-containing protein [Jannaschia seohaensis]